MAKGFALLLVILLLSLMGLGSVCVLPTKAQYQGSITISADGSISPSTAPIYRTGDSYTVTGDLNITVNNIGGSIVVQRNNSVVNGNGYFVGQILLSHVSNVTVKSFMITRAVYKSDPQGYNGLTLLDSSNVTITNNTITELRGIYEGVGMMYAGIYIGAGHSNIIVGNYLLNNEYCLYFSGTENNLVVENNIINNETELISCGIVLVQSFNNTIFHNNLEYIYRSYIPEVDISNSSNIWDIGFPAGGNYWSYYHGKEIDNSGIGDIPYFVDANNTDRYPLMKPFNSTFFRLQTTAPKILFQLAENQTFRESSVPLVFSIDVFSSNKALNWTGYSLDGQENVTTNGNTTLTGLASGQHSIIIYANDTYGNMGASVKANFTISQPFPITVVVAASGVTALIVVVGLLVYLKKHRRAGLVKKV